MIDITFRTPGDPPAWPDLSYKLDTYVLGPEDPPFQALVIFGGMPDGSDALVQRFALPDGRTLLAATSARDFVRTADVVRGRCPGVDT